MTTTPRQEAQWKAQQAQLKASERDLKIGLGLVLFQYPETWPNLFLVFKYSALIAFFGSGNFVERFASA